MENIDTATIVTTIQKPEPSKSRHLCIEFKWFLKKWQPFVRISNGQIFIFQILFRIQTIYKLNSFRPFKIQTRPDLRSPLYQLGFQMVKTIARPCVTPTFQCQSSKCFLMFFERLDLGPPLCSKPSIHKRSMPAIKFSLFNFLRQAFSAYIFLSLGVGSSVIKFRIHLRSE